MKLELTERDILLLKLSVIALIVFLTVRFLIMPNRKRAGAPSGKRTSAGYHRRDGGRDFFDSGPARTDQRKQNELSEYSRRYYGKMENHQVDELLTGLALKHGLFPVSLLIGVTEPQIPEAYRYGLTSENTAVLSEEYILTGKARIALRGDEADVYAFLDDIEETMPAVRVISMHLEERSWLDAEGNSFVQTEAGFELEIIMCEIEAAK